MVRLLFLNIIIFKMYQLRKEIQFKLARLLVKQENGECGSQWCYTTCAYNYLGSSWLRMGFS